MRALAEPHSPRLRAFRLLLSRGLLRAADRHHTQLTNRGREELARVLADYADALTRVAIVNEGKAAFSGILASPEPTETEIPAVPG